MDIYRENLLSDEKENFQQSHSPERSKTGTLWEFQTSAQLQKIKRMKGDALGTLKSYRKRLLLKTILVTDCNYGVKFERKMEFK